MSKNIKKILLSTLLTCSLALTGCWDRTELQERAFVMVVGIDKHKSKNKKGDKLKMTYLLPKFTAVKEGEEGPDSRQILISVGKTPYQATRQLTLRQDNQPFFQHMKATVLGVDIVKDPDQFLEILDGLERQDEISRKLHLFVTDGQATDVLKVKSLLKPLSYKLQGMSQKKTGTNVFIPITLEEAISSTAQGATLIPRISASDTEVRVDGSAVIKNDKFIGWLTGEDTKSVAFVRGVAKRDIVEIEYKGIDIPYIIRGVKEKKTTRIEDGEIYIDIKLTIAGDIQQYKVKEQPRFIDMEFVEELEGEITSSIEKEVEKTISKLQNEMNADVMGIDDYLKAYKPKIWQAVEDDWNEVFPKVKIRVSVDAYIEKTGSVK